jgi:hypothetical protein
VPEIQVPKQDAEDFLNLEPSILRGFTLVGSYGAMGGSVVGLVILGAAEFIDGRFSVNVPIAVMLVILLAMFVAGRLSLRLYRLDATSIKVAGGRLYIKRSPPLSSLTIDLSEVGALQFTWGFWGRTEDIAIRCVDVALNDGSRYTFAMSLFGPDSAQRLRQFLKQSVIGYKVIDRPAWWV